MSATETALAEKNAPPAFKTAAEIMGLDTAQLAVEAAAGDVTLAQYRVLKLTVHAKMTDAQLALYLTVCHMKHVNPITEAYAFPSQDGGVSIGLRIDGMRALAMRTGEYVSRSVETLFDKDGKMVGAKASVARKGMTGPVVEEAYLQEYDTGKFLWATHKETMIRKVAESKALRAAFADALSGIYEPSELPA
jgi:hypothetical protein